MFFSGIIINISPNLESISVHKRLDTIESLFIIKDLASDNSFHKAALDLLFKPSNFVPGLIPRRVCMVLATIFTAAIFTPVGSVKRTLGFTFSGFLQ